MGMEVTLPAMSTSGSEMPLAVSMPVARCTAEMIGRIKQVLSAHPGASEVHLKLVSPSGTKVMRLDNAYRVTQSSALIADLKELLGPSCVA
jgi:DNA polymerase-3 subunit alpha